MSKRLYALLSVLVLTSLVLAACTTPVTEEPPAITEVPGTDMPATDVPGTEPATEGPSAFECTDSIGCVDIGPDEPIHIAYAMVISGPDETLGIDSRTGAEVAVELKGQVLGHDIQLTGEDEGCSAEGGQAAGTKLAADPTIVAVIGTSCSSAARVAVPLLSDAGFVIISASNTAPDLTREGDPNQHPGYLRTAHNDEIQGAAAAQFAYEELGARKAATIHDGSLYAESLQAVFAKTFQEMGGEITSQEAVDPNATDFTSVLTSIAAGEPEFIYHPIFVNAGSLIINQTKQVPGLEEVKQMGADGMFSPDVVEGAGAAVEGTYVSSPDLAAFSEDYQTTFLPKYKELSGADDPVSIFHAHAFDAANMIFAAIEQVAVQDADGTLHIPRQALRDAMYATENFAGLTGNLTCTPTGDCADPKIAVYQYHAGEYPPERIWP
jgi:branched-chain amino acid transport system substrate-binding protein